jgi:CheY-like chemotaxis protein
MKEDINKALEVGFNGYITKPIDIKSFLKLQDERLGS